MSEEFFHKALKVTALAALIGVTFYVFTMVALVIKLVML